MDLCTSAFLQQIAGQILSHPNFSNHLANSRKYYHHQAEIMHQTLKKYLPDSVSWTRPQGGLFIWLTLPPHMDSAILHQQAISAKVAFTPGYIFRPSHKPSHQLRLSYANTTPNQMNSGLAILGNLITNMAKSRLP